MCPTLSGKAFIEWRDANTGARIAIYREGESELNCKVAADRAVSLMAKVNNGSMEPTKRIIYSRLAIALIIPVAILWALAYVLVNLYRWVAAGFRHE